MLLRVDHGIGKADNLVLTLHCKVVAGAVERKKEFRAVSQSAIMTVLVIHGCNLTSERFSPGRGNTKDGHTTQMATMRIKNLNTDRRMSIKGVANRLPRAGHHDKGLLEPSLVPCGLVGTVVLLLLLLLHPKVVELRYCDGGLLDTRGRTQTCRQKPRSDRGTPQGRHQIQPTPTYQTFSILRTVEPCIGSCTCLTCGIVIDNSQRLRDCSSRENHPKSTVSFHLSGSLDGPGSGGSAYRDSDKWRTSCRIIPSSVPTLPIHFAHAL